MENAAIRLERLQKSLTGQSDVCSSGGPVRDFPESFRKGFRNFGIGLIVCTQGEFRFSLASGAYTAAAGETVFIPKIPPSVSPANRKIWKSASSSTRFSPSKIFWGTWSIPSISTAVCRPTCRVSGRPATKKT